MSMLSFLFCFLISQPTTCIVESQDLERYQFALSVIKSDTALLNEFCGIRNRSVAVYDKYEFISLHYFEDRIAESRSVSLAEAKELLKESDKPFSKKKNRIDYHEFDPRIHSKLNKDGIPCAIVGFDKIKNGFLIAEVTYYLEEEWWSEIRNHQVSYLILFDFNVMPIEYHTLKLER